ncbi:MAG TPA: hypothetical protein VKU60_20705, partial [Chloroflexota bacterium]|nr:hypothetical protein [Chloroflexota bacterium]
MRDDVDQALAVDVLTACLSRDEQETGDLFDFLARKLELTLPGKVTVRRKRGLFVKAHPVQDIVLELGDNHFTLRRTDQGAPEARIRRVVRGVVLKTEDVSVPEWIEQLAAELA